MSPQIVTVEKASIEQCIKNGKRMRWRHNKIVHTLGTLGFTDKEIADAMEARGDV